MNIFMGMSTAVLFIIAPNGNNSKVNSKDFDYFGSCFLVFPFFIVIVIPL